MKTSTEIISKNEKLYHQEALILEATELLSSIMQDCGVSKAELAQRLDTSKSHITQCLSGQQNLTLRTLADFFTALEYQLELGANPLSKEVGQPLHRLYATGVWALEKQRSHELIIDVAGSEELDAGSELCDAA